MRIVAVIVLLLVTSLARAQDASCDPEVEDCGCHKDWGCFELVYMAKGAVLGVKSTITYVNEAGRDLPAASFATTYMTERYATRNGLALHIAAAGTLGGGTAGTETAGSATLSFGFRGVVTEKSGPFLRAGMTGSWLSNARLRLSIFEPLQGRIGYQILEGDDVLEIGMTQGLVALGSYRPAAGTRKLSESIELGGYGAWLRDPFRVNASFMHIFPQATDRGGDVDLGRIAYCDYRLAVTLCADVLYVRGDADIADRQDRLTQSLYTGLTIGLSP